MTEEMLFKKLHEEYDGNPFVNMLIFRGFLIDEVDGEYYLSDNSHDDDSNYLAELLDRYSAGRMEESKIVLKPDADAKAFEAEFQESEGIRRVVCSQVMTWAYFRHRKHGHKAPVRILEPYIATFVKAITAAGVMTCGSCDGNHPGACELYLQYEVCGSSVWMKLILENLVSKEFSDRLSSTGHIPFGEKSKFETYYELFKVSTRIYKNRVLLREIKQEALKKYSNSFLKEASNDEIGKLFSENVIELFRERKNKIIY